MIEKADKLIDLTNQRMMNFISTQNARNSVKTNEKVLK